jgi:hypothetical protein
VPTVSRGVQAGTTYGVPTDDRPAWFRAEAERIKRIQVLELVAVASLLVLLLVVGEIFGPGPWLWVVLPPLLVLGVAHYSLTYRRLRLALRAKKAGIKPRYGARQLVAALVFGGLCAAGCVWSAVHEAWGNAIVAGLGVACFFVIVVRSVAALRQRSNL